MSTTVLRYRLDGKEYRYGDYTVVRFSVPRERVHMRRGNGEWFNVVLNSNHDFEFYFSDPDLPKPEVEPYVEDFLCSFFGI